MKKQYSAEQKASIVNRYLSGMEITQLAKDTGISRSTIYKWITESEECQKQKRKVNMQDFFDLKQKCEQQEQMIEVLQAAPCTVTAPLND